MISGNFALILFGACIFVALVALIPSTIIGNEWDVHNARRHGMPITYDLQENIQHGNTQRASGQGIVTLLIFGALFVAMLLGMKP